MTIASLIVFTEINGRWPTINGQEQTRFPLACCIPTLAFLGPCLSLSVFVVYFLLPRITHCDSRDHACKDSPSITWLFRELFKDLDVHNRHCRLSQTILPCLFVASHIKIMNIYYQTHLVPLPTVATFIASIVLLLPLTLPFPSTFQHFAMFFLVEQCLVQVTID